MLTDTPTAPWSIPPELQQRLPRPVTLTGLGITSCIVALLCIAAGIGLAAKAINGELHRQAANMALAHQMTAGGRETQATVTSLRNSLGHVVAYAFTVDDHSYQKSAFITPEHWQALQIGSPLPIRYFPRDPDQSYPTADPPNAQNHWAVVLALAAMALFFMFSFAAFQLSAVLPRRALLATGTPVRGVITDCRRNQGRRGGYVLHYDYIAEDGTQYPGRAVATNQLPLNASVTILYNPTHPRRSTIYPMETVKLTTT